MRGLKHFLTLKTLYIMTFTILHLKGENPFDIDPHRPPSSATKYNLADQHTRVPLRF